jgi:ELWxxDGT repeat protein
VHDSLYGQELWASDGTASGTAMVKDINPGNSSAFSTANLYSMYPNVLQVLNGKLYFIADDGISGSELWISDGTAAGTQMLKDINPGSAGSVLPPSGQVTESFVLAGGKIYFPADDGTGTGTELWATDGTANGTQLVADIVPGATGSNPRNLLPYGNKVVFSVSYFTTSGQRSVYISNGTSAGTLELLNGMDNTNDHAILNNKLYFCASDNNQTYLYQTDGTAANTSSLLALSLESGIVPGDAGNGEVCLTAFNNKLYFRNSQSSTGTELWQSDGTVGGAAMLKDMYIGPMSTYPNTFTELNGKLFFRTEDSLLLNVNYTDGTTAGTMKVTPPIANYYIANPFTKQAYSAYPLVPVGSSLFFVNLYDMAIKIYVLTVPAGIDEQTAFGTIDIYPNPTQGFINLETKNAPAVAIYCINGTCLYNSNIPKGTATHKLDISSFPPGTYTITTLLSNGRKKHGKFVKQ